jgi:hypothetical protein
MTNDAELANPPDAGVPVRSPQPNGCARTVNGRLGLRWVTVRMRETEIDVLIRRGLLKADARNTRRSSTSRRIARESGKV